jgi:hypothetical protein
MTQIKQIYADIFLIFEHKNLTVEVAIPKRRDTQSSQSRRTAVRLYRKPMNLFLFTIKETLAPQNLSALVPS